VLGHDVRRDPAAIRRLVGSQLQDSALPDRLRVWEALHLFSVLGPGGRPWPELLDEWGLTAKRDTAFGDLSGGQQQRLFVALALVADPRLVVLDEMTTGLDPAGRRLTWDLVDAVRGRGATVLLVTHFMDEAERLCDRVAVLDHGRVIASGTTAELVLAHAPRRTVRFTLAPDGTGADGAAGSDRGTGRRTWDRAALRAELQALTGVASVVADPGGRVRVEGTGPVLARVAHRLVEDGLEPEDLTVDTPSLEDAYLALTGAGGDE
jgi:ABC-2 type transport system ATP-binding protein